jgi:hypothetical protein
MNFPVHPTRGVIHGDGQIAVKAIDSQTFNTDSEDDHRANGALPAHTVRLTA